MDLVFNYDKDLPKPNEYKLDYLRKQVNKLYNTHQPVQKSPEWYEMRNGLLTASDWGKILDGKNDVLLKKCGDDRFIGGAAIDWGNKYEQVANLIYQKRNNVEVLEFGCLRHPYIDFLGASPDGITPDGIMVEIKCPYTRKITGIPKPEYWCQVQGQLEVCDLDRCDFIECCLKEYADENDYLNDNYNEDFSLNSIGNEKGVIADFYIKSSKTYIKKYSSIGLIGEELDNWKNKIILETKTEDIIFSNFTYWFLEEVSCIPIFRNQEWFQTNRPKLQLFWNNVLKYRELGLEKLREDISNGNVNININNDIYEKKNGKKQKVIQDYIEVTQTQEKTSVSTKSRSSKSNKTIILTEENDNDVTYEEDFKTNTYLFSS